MERSREELIEEKQAAKVGQPLQNIEDVEDELDVEMFNPKRERERSTSSPIDIPSMIAREANLDYKKNKLVNCIDWKI